MQIPHPNFNRARSLFQKVYNNNRVNLTGSKHSLDDQLEFYLDHLGSHIGSTVKAKDRKRIWSVIERNNQVARILEAPNYRSAVKKNKQLLGNTILGFVFCIDGRIPAVFLGGRFAKHFEIPAAEITTIKRKSDKKLIPDSTDLNEALRNASLSDKDLLEICLAHTSLSDPHHGCGAMAGKRKAGLLDPKLSNEEANIKIIEETTIPAISNIYNEFREQNGQEPLKQIGISAVYDTDTFGLIFNFQNKENSLSTSELTKKYAEKVNDYFIKNNLVFGSFRDKFTELKYLTTFAGNEALITEGIIYGKINLALTEEINQFIITSYPGLTENQKKTLVFVIAKNMAFQHLTGLCSLKKKSLDHPFLDHEEGYMAVAMRGGTIGKFDPENQCFASTPADPQGAIANINTMLSIMGDSAKIKPYILFVCNSIYSRDLRENDQVAQRLMGSNAGLLRDIIADKTLGKMIEEGKIIPVPVLIAEDTREVLRVIDHAAYI